MSTTPDQDKRSNKITHNQYKKNKKEIIEMLKVVRQRNLEKEQKKNQE